MLQKSLALKLLCSGGWCACVILRKLQFHTTWLLLVSDYVLLSVSNKIPELVCCINQMALSENFLRCHLLMVMYIWKLVCMMLNTDNRATEANSALFTWHSLIELSSIKYLTRSIKNNLCSKYKITLWDLQSGRMRCNVLALHWYSCF